MLHFLLTILGVLFVTNISSALKECYQCGSDQNCAQAKITILLGLKIDNHCSPGISKIIFPEKSLSVRMSVCLSVCLSVPSVPSRPIPSPKKSH